MTDRILFCSREPAYPDVVGGGVITIHFLAVFAKQRGCTTGVASAAKLTDSLALKLLEKVDHLVRKTRLTDHVRADRERWVESDFSGYSTYRCGASSIIAALPDLIRRFRPDLVVAQGMEREVIAMVARNLGVPVIIRAVCAECVDALAAYAQAHPEFRTAIDAREIAVISNSHFTSDRVQALLGVPSPVTYPLIPLTDCISENRSPRHITFVNPTEVKGVEIALGVAAVLPHRQFLFQESWPLAGKDRRSLVRRLHALPNVELHSPVLDMKTVYETTSVLLMPSQWEEAFGRVALEACANGIPVLASDIGGIPEALGPGGLLVNPRAGVDEWATLLEATLSDEELYSELSAAGRRHAMSAQFAPHAIASSLLDEASRLMRGPASARF